jgi:hypothetical protein
MKAPPDLLLRILSRANFERRIEELKQDSEGAEQGTLIRGIYVLEKMFAALWNAAPADAEAGLKNQEAGKQDDKA